METKLVKESYMRKSVPGFVLGLIGFLFCLGWGYIFGIVGDIVGGIAGSTGSEAADAASGVANTITTLGWLCFLGAIAGIVGASLCFKKARIGGIVMICATAVSAPLLIYAFVQSIKAGTLSPSTIITILLPLALIVAGDVCAILAKPRAVVNQPNGYYNPNMYQQPQQPMQQQQPSQNNDQNNPQQ